MATTVTAPSGEASLPRRPVVDSDAAFVHARLAVVALFFIGHCFLAVFMKTIPGIATAHAVACLVAAVIYAATTKRLRNISIVLGYLAGCEVLWRMCKAGVFWEFGKYSLALVLLIALLRTRSPRNRGFALAYFALLLPSIALTLTILDLDRARQEVSFYLAGPLVLTLAVLYYSNVRTTGQVLVSTFLSFIGPIVGIGALSFLSTRAQDQIEFVNAANSFASGGFGPNQVAAMLGLAVMFLILIIVELRLVLWVRICLLVLALALAAQSALTFSRGGVVLALAGLAGAMFYLLRGNRRARIVIILTAIVTVLIVQYVIQPRLEQITNGQISARYSNTSSSGRDRFIRSELALFKENPVLGVGPGIGMHLREERGLFYGASHTEYSRMVAEHGLFGVGALICLIVLAVRAFRQARTKTDSAHVTAMVIWCGLFLLVYGTRVAAPAFVFGLAFARTSLLTTSAAKTP